MNDEEIKNNEERLIVFKSNEEDNNEDKKMRSIELLYDDDDIAIAQIDLMHQDDTKEDHNRNMCNISHDAILNSLETFRNKPILYRLNDKLDDVTEHAYNLKELRNTHICGIIPEDTKFEFVKNENNGKTYIRCDVILYKNYCPDLINILKKNDGNLEISTELKVYGEQDKDSGILYIKNFILQGSMILSKKVMAGIEGSNIQVLKFSSMETSNMNMRYLQFSKKREEINIDGINAETKKIGEKEVKEILNSLSVEEISDLLWIALDKYKYRNQDGYEYRKYYVYKLYVGEDSYVILTDNEESIRKLYKVRYSIDENKVLTLDIENKVEVVEKIDYKEISNCFVLPKNLYGTSDEIIIENSKEKVIENDFNGLQNVLNCNKILNAKNYKELVNSAFLLVENDFEDNPLEKLKYPVMDFSNNSLVYNAKALEFSLAKATEDNNKEIIDKINSIKESLEFSRKENENVENKDLESKDVDNSIGLENQQKENWQEKYNALNEEYTNFKNSYVEKEKEFNDKILELENYLKENNEKLEKYEKEEKFSKMQEYAKKYNACISEEANTLIAQKLQNSQECKDMEFSEFKTFVDDIVLESIVKVNNSKIVKNSVEQYKSKETIENKTIDNTIQRRYGLESFLGEEDSQDGRANINEVAKRIGA